MADVITRFRLETTQFDSKLRDASKELSRISSEAVKSGKSFEGFSKANVDAARALGQTASGATNAKDKVRDLVGAYNDAAKAYDKLTEEQKKSDFGKAMVQSMDQLKGRIKDAKKELYDTKNGVSALQSAMTELGGRFGISSELMSALTTGTIAYTAAIGAAVTAVIAATKAWADYNSELARQDQITSVTTGLKGGDADNMTSAARSISRVYGSDFREVINAANTLMSQFGQTGDEAIQTIRDGMQGMIQGDGPKLLSMIQQYAPSFRDAGISASQLVAVIQNSEGGIFTDQNMNAIVMGIRNIRLMTDQTGQALAKMGIDGQKMSEQLNNGTLTIFDALKQVAHQLQTVDSNSKTAGEVMQAVFGRQGTMAGTNLAKAIETLNTNLDETKRQTGEVGEKFAELEQANERLEKAIRECFGYDGWQTMATGIKTELVGALATVLELTQKIKDSWVGEIVGTIFDSIMDGIENTIPALAQMLTMLRLVKSESGGDGNGLSSGAGIAGVLSGAGTVNGGELPEVVIKPFKRQNRTPKGGGRSSNVNKSDEILPVGSVAALNKELAELRKKQELATDTATWDSWQEKIDGITSKIKLLKGEIPYPNKIQSGGKGVSVLGIGTGQERLDSAEKQLKAMLPEDGIHIPVKLDINNDALNNTSKVGKQVSKSFSMATEAASQLGSALASIEDPGAKAAGTVLQAIASIALGFAQASVQASSMGPWGWVAFLAAGAAAMATTINTMHSLTNLSEGGFVPGNSYSGDNIYGGNAMVNSGELVLNTSQQNNLANALTGGASNLQLSAKVSGEQILLVANRHLKRSGKGELVSWR